jgi:chaperone modulatory protein CbpM
MILQPGGKSMWAHLQCGQNEARTLESRYATRNGTQALVLWRTANSLLTLEDLADTVALHPKRVEKILAFGLIEVTASTSSGPLFSATTVERLRRIVRLRRDLGVNMAGIAAILDMRERILNLQAELGRLRGRLDLLA